MNDTIRRSDAIKAFCMDCKGQSAPCEHSGTCKTLKVLRSRKKIPAAEPKQGEWIEVESCEYETHSVTDMRCNLCGKYSQMVLPFQTKCVYPRCPFCGAKMKGAGNEV